MFKKNILIVFAISFWGFGVFAQSISRKVVSNSGGTLTGGGYQITYTLGETMTPTLTASNAQITQGFQQPGEQLLTGSVGNTICAGSTISVPFSAMDIGAGNTFTVQLSDGSGSFASPVSIGSSTGTASGSINATIPANTVLGSAYRIRVVGSFPTTIGMDNGSDITISAATLHTTTVAACDSYVWAAPLGTGLTYTTSQSGITFVSTNTFGCSHTEKLNLSINTSTTNGSTIVSATGLYTWPLPLGTGQTYTTSGIYTNTTTNTAGCPNVATLNLTIGSSTVNTFNIGTSCGATVSGLAVTIIAAPVSGATVYTFRLTNMATSTVQLINRPVNSFALSNYPGITLGTPYQIEVSVNSGPFGPPCIVNTPAPISNIGTQCGTTLTSMTQYVYTTYVASATGYRFRITDTATNAVQFFDSALNRFFFNQLPNRSFGTTYLVEVSLRNTDGSYLPYNIGCTIATPAFPTTTIQTSQCEYTATSNKETIYATLVSGATDYRFFLSRTVTPTYSSFIERPLSSFSLSMFTGLTAGTTYLVQVAVKIGGVWGPLGTICHITTPGAVRTINPTADFNVIAYPNPFAEGFKLKLISSTDNAVQIRVYDMLGKQIENGNREATDVENLELGLDYPSGVYHVIVSQDENIKTLRIIKR